MNEIGIENARATLGEIVDLARIAGRPTRITRQGKPAAVLVSAEWFSRVGTLLSELGNLHLLGDDLDGLFELENSARALRAAVFATPDQPEEGGTDSTAPVQRPRSGPAEGQNKTA